MFVYLDVFQHWPRRRLNIIQVIASLPPRVSLAGYLRPSTSTAYSPMSAGPAFLIFRKILFPSLKISVLSVGSAGISSSPLNHLMFGVSLTMSQLKVAVPFGLTCWSLMGFTNQSLITSAGQKVTQENSLADFYCK